MAAPTLVNVMASVEQGGNMDDAFLEEARRMMDIDTHIFTDLHLANLPGSSNSPHLQLMGMPKEIREAILRHLLVKDDLIWVNFDFEMRNGRFRETSSMLRHPLVVGPKHITSIIRVNKQTAQEATDILYGANMFASYQVHAFESVFVKDPDNGIGIRNAAKIKSAEFTPPMNTFTGPKTDGHQSLLDFLCSDLINLKKLTLKTVAAIRRWTLRDIIDREQVNLIRHLLLIAANVTKFHPTLRKAVWRRWSGTKLADQWGREPGFGKGTFYIWAEFSVDLVPEGPEAVLEGSITKKNAHGEDIECKDMVINSQLVRQTDWNDVRRWLNVHTFALPSAAVSSEVDANEIEVWPGTGKCPV
ncbi:hypothetical protein EDD36DRAFT_269452 [Exophiala viscosa]|uniref:Uncharacterized protein n=1 Tax=Exophiala viscosa TaxID=2486360 RepID=A0AAN6IC01_9EURO|nr:hypothetical protein EDD36DRAFT_269452 [Exophiala viscosa]